MLWVCSVLINSMLHSGLGSLGSSPGSALHCVLGQDTFISKCLSPPRCINQICPGLNANEMRALTKCPH